MKLVSPAEANRGPMTDDRLREILRGLSHGTGWHAIVAELLWSRERIRGFVIEVGDLNSALRAVRRASEAT